MQPGLPLVQRLSYVFTYERVTRTESLSTYTTLRAAVSAYIRTLICYFPPSARATDEAPRTHRRATRAGGEVGVCKRCISLQDVFFTALPSNFELSVKFNSFIRLLSDFRAGSKNFTKIGIPKPPVGLRVGL